MAMQIQKSNGALVEAGGWGDAVAPLVSPRGTPGEWFEDPYGELGYTFSGPGEFLRLVPCSKIGRLVLMAVLRRHPNPSADCLSVHSWRKGLHGARRSLFDPSVPR